MGGSRFLAAFGMTKISCAWENETCGESHLSQRMRKMGHPASNSHSPLTGKREVAAPAVGDDEPCAQPSPHFHILATIGADRAVGLADGDVITSDFHGQFTRGFH